MVGQVERRRDEEGLRRRREHVAGGRHRRHVVKVSPEEAGALALRAERLGMTVPRLLVEAALNEGESSVEAVAVENADRARMRAELAQLQRGVGAIGVNVNQIARVANAAGEVSEELTGSLAHVRSVLRRIEAFADEWSVLS